MNRFWNTVAAIVFGCDFLALAILILVAAPIFLSGCSTQQEQKIISVGCTLDRLAPSVVAAAGTVGTIVSPANVAAVQAANAADQAVHPLVQAACNAALPGSVPVAGTVSAVSVPIAAPVSQTTAVILPVDAQPATK